MLKRLLPLLLLGACATQSDLRNDVQWQGAALAGLPVLDSASACRESLARHRITEVAQNDVQKRGQNSVRNGASQVSYSFELLSWNIKKGLEEDWSRDLETLGADKDLVLIQEATTAMLTDSALPFMPDHADFAPGYESRDGITGVATFSNTPPDVSCQFQALEPWLRTPKATKITRYDLGETSLVVANIHMVNFAFGLSAFRSQLDQLSQALDGYPGPMIVSGDFNTWSDARYQLLLQRMAELGAAPVAFSNDQRTRYFGDPVDHVFVAGLEVEAAATPVVTSSDHNPLSLRLTRP